jgi:cytochrome c556
LPIEVKYRTYKCIRDKNDLSPPHLLQEVKNELPDDFDAQLYEQQLTNYIKNVKKGVSGAKEEKMFLDEKLKLVDTIVQDLQQFKEKVEKYMDGTDDVLADCLNDIVNLKKKNNIEDVDTD